MAISKRFASEEYVNETCAPLSHSHSWSDVATTTTYGDTLTWDGNTEGRNTFNNFYFVSSAVPTEADFSNGGTLTVFSAGNLESVEIGGSLGLVVWADVSEQFGTEAHALVVTIDGNMLVGVLPNGAELNGVVYEKGVYFQKPDDITYTSSLTINGFNGFEQTETVPLPNKYLDFIDTVGGDTLVWDGNTDGLYSVLDTIYHVSEVIPTLTDLQNGGAIEVSTTGTEEKQIITFTAENVMDGATAGIGTDFIIISTGLLSVIIATSDKASMTEDETTISFGKAGVYFSGAYDEGLYIYTSSLTINEYTGFPKEQIKQEYLPKSQSDNSAYDFIVNITLDGSTAESDKSLDEIIAVVNKGTHPKLKLGTRLVHDYEVDTNSDSINFYMCTMQSDSLKMYLISISKTTDGTTHVSYNIY